METWNAVDRWFDESLSLTDGPLRAALAASEAAGLPAIAVSAPQGKLLNLLARQCNARRILEVGTLGGYSGLWLARALPPGGKLVTLELDPTHARVARENFAHAGFADRVEVRVGRAIDSLAQLATQKAGPFDFTFIDADKASTPDYLEFAIRLSRPGAFIVVDNVVRKGAVLLASSDDASVQGIRKAIAMLGEDPRVEATAIQTVGDKGYDGFALALVLAPR
jgi:predicted O-methyltransferase YrrM